MLRWLIALGLLFDTACSAAATPETGGLRILTNAPRAILYVDELEHGRVDDYSEGYLQLSPGRHLLRLEHRDFFTEEIEVVLIPDLAVTVSLELRRRPGEDRGE